MRADLCEVRRYLKSISNNAPFFERIVSGGKLTPTQRRALILYIEKQYSIKKISFEMYISDSSIYRLLESSYVKILEYLRENKIEGFDSFEGRNNSRM